MSISLLRQLLMKEAVKKSAGSSGIMTINKNIATDVDKLLQKYVNDALAQGVDLETLSPEQLKMIVAMNTKATNKVISGEVIPFKQKRSFAEEIDSMKKSGDIVDKDNIIISDKITDREMFKNSNLNKPTVEGQMEKITGASNRIKEIQKEQADMYKPKTDAEIKAKFDKQNKESIQRFKDKMKKDEPEDKAYGGRIGFRAGKFVLDKIIAKLLGNPKKVKQATDDIFPTGDYKYDAQMAADALVENNPKTFKGMLYEDLDLDTQIEIYGAVLKPITNNMAKMRELKKLSKPEKTLASMNEGKGINMSDPDIADEFARFMKETDPKGTKELEQKIELSNFDTKNRKKNATGGRARFQQGGLPAIDSRMNLDYSTLVEQNTDPMLQALKSQNTSSYRAPTARIQPTPEGTMGPISLDDFEPQNPNSPTARIIQPGGPSDDMIFRKQPVDDGGSLVDRDPNLVERIIPQDSSSYYQGKDYGPGAGMSYAANNPDSGMRFVYDEQGQRYQIPTSQPGSLEEYLSGYEKYKSTNPNTYTGTQALIDATLPGGINYTFGSGPHANHFNDYLESIGLSPYEKNLNAIFNKSVKFNKGGRAGFYTGGITDVEPDLSDIGHGSDSLMARTRLVSPGSQATTSTGLNYLLAEDNDNMRVPFGDGNTVSDKIKTMHKDFDDYRKGGGKISYKKFAAAYIPENFADGGPARQNFAMGKRAFLKMLAGAGAGIAGLKSGLIGFGGKGATKKAVTETVKQTAPEGVPPYFLNLVKKIKTMGDDVTEKSATQERQKVTKYKDYELTEDAATGRQEIQRMKVLDDDSASYYGQPLTEETYMSYTPGENIIGKGGKPVKTKPEYEEGTAFLRSDKQFAGDVVDESATISDDVIKEGTMFEDTIAEFGKADGGRIGLFMGGGFMAGKGLAREMLKFMSKGSTNAKSPTELLQLYNPKQFNKLLNNPKNTGKISPATGETADEMILDMISKTKDDRSSMVGDLIGSARKIKKVDDDIIAYKKKIIKQMIDGGIDEKTARSFAELMGKEMKNSAAPLLESPPKITEQGLLELENIQKNLMTKNRKLQATGGLTTMLGE